MQQEKQHGAQFPSQSQPSTYGIMSQLVMPSETTFTDVSDLSDASSPHDIDESVIDSQSIKQIMIETEKNLKILIKIDSNTFDTLVNELELSLLKQLKQTLKQVKNESMTHQSFNNSNSNNKEKQIIEYENNEHKSDTNDFLNVLVNDADNATVVSDTTAFTVTTGVTGVTGVSSIAAPISMNDPLIVMMGIGEYDGMPNLDGIARDYDNIIDTFVKYWKYKIFYRLNDNKYIYTNSKDDIKSNYKLKWDGDEIDEFIEESRKYLVQNKHNGLMFAISSHGDSGRVLYDSECEIYELDAIFSVYSPAASVLLESYQETEEETNSLFSIPKIFFLDMCRGSGKAKVTKVVSSENEIKETKQGGSTAETDEMGNEAKKEDDSTVLSTEVPQQQSEKKTQEDQSMSKPVLSLHKNNNNENLAIKGISKEEAHTLVGQMANFAKIYANIEGFSVADGSQQGGIFLRNVCKVFKDTKFVTSHKFTDMVFKIREYTKREATLNGTLFNFTQIVENEGTLEREVIFGSKYANIAPLLLDHPHLSTLDEMNHFDGFIHDHDGAESGHNKLCITNICTRNKIGVLVEMEQNRENRREMFKKLENDNYNAFIDNGFVIIDKDYHFHEFDKVWDEYYVTLFILRTNREKNELIYDRRMYFNDYLYCKNKQLYTLDDGGLLPKCNAMANASHMLYPSGKNQSLSGIDSYECRLCLTSIPKDELTFACRSCDESLCKKCCHSLIMNEIPKGMKESKYFNWNTIINSSPSNKIAVLVNIYHSYDKQRHEVINNLEMDKKLKDPKEFLKKGFVIIDSNGGQHEFKTVWSWAYITIIEIANLRTDKSKVAISKYLRYDKNPIYYYGNIVKSKLLYIRDLVPNCQCLGHTYQSMILVSNNSSNNNNNNNSTNNNNSAIKKNKELCSLCLSNTQDGNFSCYCKRCKESLCHNCINSIILNKIPSNMKRQEIRVYNSISNDCKVGVLLNGCYLGKFKRKKIAKKFGSSATELIKQGFKIVHPGQAVSINTTCESYCVTLIKFWKTQLSGSYDSDNRVICDMKEFTCSDLWCTRTYTRTNHYAYYKDEVFSALDHLTDISCQTTKNETHILTRILVNEESINGNDNLNICVFCRLSKIIKNGKYCYYCKQCKHSLCQQCFDLIICKQTPLRLRTHELLYDMEQKSKSLMQISMTRLPKDLKLEYRIESEITNGAGVVKDSHSISAQNEIELNINELEKEFKESQLQCNVKVVIIDAKNNIQSSFHPIMKNFRIYTRIGFDYNCTFTTLNGVGRYGPTNMDEYKGQRHYNDTKLDNRQKGMQFWTVPKTGKYKVVCYGAKGGDSKEGDKRLFGGKGAKVGSILKLFKNDMIKIACGQKGKDCSDDGGGGGGGGGSYFILYKIGNKNANYKENEIVNIPLCIAAGGNGACAAKFWRVNGIDGLCNTSENRNNYGGYETNGKAGRGASFKNDFDIFQSYKFRYMYDYNKCNPMSFLNGAIGGEGDFPDGRDGGFGGGGGSHREGGGGGGYIGGLVSRIDRYSNEYSSYGALSYICKNDNIVENVNGANKLNNMMISGANNDNGRIHIMFLN